MDVASDIFTIVFVRAPEYLLSRWKFIVFMGIVVTVVVGYGMYKSSQPKMAPVPVYNLHVPTTAYIGVTSSRIYYINSYKNLDAAQILLIDYYSFENSKWIREKIPLQLISSGIKIIKR